MQRLTLSFRQGRDQFTQPHHHVAFIFIMRPMRFASSLGCGILLIVRDDHAPPAGAVARPIATEVDGDGIQPRPDFSVWLKPRISAVSAQPGLLEQIRGIVPIA